MATLRHLDTQNIRPLPARLLVGRAGTAALKLDDPKVSGEHATVLWSKGAWVIRDLGSRNGTFVDGKRLAAGDAVALQAGSQLGFGSEDDLWELVDAGPPSALAEDLATGQLILPEEGILALPTPANPEVVVFENGRGGFSLERGDEASEPIADGAIVQLTSQSFRIRLPANLEGTATVDAGARIDTIRLRFAVSRDEEHVQVTVIHRGKETALEEREHGYILLTLARQRIEDKDEPLSEQGWIDRERLLKMIQVDPNALNVAIYRARGQLTSAGVEGAAGIVDVRRGQRRLGIEPDRLEVVPL